MGNGFPIYCLAISLFFLASCERAQRYPPIRKTSPEKTEKSEPLPPSFAWIMPKPVADIPIVFIPSDSPDWPKLSGFWNEFPASPLGIDSVHLGQNVFGVLAGMNLAMEFRQVKIKVPLGLPDPTPFIPRANAPQVGAWELGRELFFEPMIQGSGEKLSCNSCHPPPHFTLNLAHFQNPRNAPSLLNSVFNRRQFWDGRVQFLEQTIFPNSASGANPSAKNIDPDHPGSGHHFDGLIEYLRLHDGMKKKYYPRFQKVFGIPEPTQDGIAKSLATYVRTLLSGNSVYDQAEVERKKAKAAALSTVHFDAAMDSPSAKKIDASAKREELVADLLLGYQIFHGKGRCFICHPNPLFTDHDFHNVGLGELADEIAGHETGRFPQVPVGVKEVRLIGAYRTPSLRNLPGSFPYTHDGRMKTLEAVIQYFNRIPPFHVTRSLAREFWIGPGQARNLDLTQDEIRSLVRFLRSLQGEPVDAKLLPQTK